MGDGPLHELTTEAYEATMRLNATTHVTASAPVLRRMLAQEPDEDGSRGAIVNMGSVLATRPVPELFATHAYAVSKGAVAALTTTTAAYYAPHGIRVNAVSPGVVPVPTLDRMHAGEIEHFWPKEASRSGLMGPLMKQRSANVPIGRKGTPRDIANAVLFLVSDLSSYITGQNIVVDGGWTLV